MSDQIRDSFNRFYEAIGKSYRALNDDRVRIEDRKAQMLRLLESGFTIPEPPKGAGEYRELCRETMDGARVQLQNWQSMIRRIDHFAENAVEATSTIQHYTLTQGLTWVDTPGLHSLTTEHGDLAKEYIQFADLVVYLTPSSSPFKKDEREMLGELLRMGKPVILAITKSDIVDEDEADGEIVCRRIPKSDRDRQTQEQYVTEQVREINSSENLENTRILSLSVMLARDAVAQQNTALYETSNLGKFLAQMGDILSEKAIELKMRRPKAEINAFIGRLTGSDGGVDDSILTIRQLRSELASKQELLQNVQIECKKAEGAICTAIEQMFPVSLSRLFRSLRDRKLLGDAQAVSAEMSEDVSRLTAEECRRVLSEKLGGVSMGLELPRLQVKASNGAEYQVEYFNQVVSRRVECAPKGLLENLLYLIDKDRKFHKTVNDTEKIAVGDNFNAFLDAQVESLRPEVHKYVSELIDRMVSSCIVPLSDCYQQLDVQLEKLADELEGFRFTD